MGRSPRLRRGLKAALMLVMAVGGLYVARLALGLGTAAIHYGSTPSFAEYVASHPFDSDTIAQRLPPGELITSNRHWMTGAIDPLSLNVGEGDHERANLTLVIDITHGDEILLDLKEEFSVALRRKDWTHHGVHIEVASLRTAPDWRAIVVTSLSEPEKMVGDDSMAEGGAIVDVFLVAGKGESETRFQLRPEGNIWGGSGDLSGGFSFPYWRLVTGITHNLEELPAEGLVHHVRQRIAFDWQKYENGHGGPSMNFTHHRANTDEYSHGVEIQIQHSMDGKSAGEYKQSKSLRREWNGVVW